MPHLLLRIGREKIYIGKSCLPSLLSQRSFILPMWRVNFSPAVTTIWCLKLIKFCTYSF